MSNWLAQGLAVSEGDHQLVLTAGKDSLVADDIAKLAIQLRCTLLADPTSPRLDLQVGAGLMANLTSSESVF
jgi:hypothetical protein